MPSDLQPPAPAPAGAPPLHGEPLPIEFANTVFPVRDVLQDLLRVPAGLVWWLDACRDRLATQLPAGALRAVTASDVECFVLLRDATRRLIHAYVNHLAPDPVDVAQVNRVSGVGRSWPLLTWREGALPSTEEVFTAPPLVAVQAEIAHGLIALLSGASGIEPRACTAPGCVFFFDHARSRRQWCSTGCGNRARAARHYARHAGGHRRDSGGH
jgi:predicted RNA-binding Zn ribbon-like protein